MTDEKARALGARAVTCAGWKWMTGMRGVCPGRGGSARMIDTMPQRYPWQFDHPDGWSVEDLIPDLRDPATLGCLLALVREAWGDPSLHVQPDNTGCGWWWSSSTADGLIHTNEAEALVAALEAAP